MRQHLDVEDKDYPSGVDTLGERVAAERGAKGWSQARLAEEVSRRGFKIGQSGIGNLEKRGDSEPKCIHELAASLGVTVEWLKTGRGVKVANGTQLPPRDNVHDIDITGRRPLREGDTGPPPLLIFRTVPDTRGRQEGFMLMAQPAGEVECPEFLRYSEKAFAAKVLDDKNSPAYRRRDLVLIDPDSPTIELEDCLFTDDPHAPDGAFTVIGCLIRSTASCWYVRQYAVKGERELAKSAFPNAWPIVGRYNRR